MNLCVDETIDATLAERGMTCVEHLGSGVFGDAFLVNTGAGELRVVKRSKQGCGSPYSISEAANMRTLTSDHTVHVYQAWCDDRDGRFYLELEYCNGGDLEQYLSKHHPLSSHELLSIATQIIMGVDHIHVRHMLHRDIKLENVFLHYGDGVEPIVKIGDFGLSKHVSSTEARAETCLGTPLYLAPELLNGHSYSRRADLWALGVLLFRLMTNQAPFEGPTLQDVARNILTGATVVAVDSAIRQTQLCDIANALLSPNRELRPSTRVILQAQCFSPILYDPPWLPHSVHRCVALFACCPHQNTALRELPCSSAACVLTVRYGDQVRAQRGVYRGTNGEMWLEIVHPVHGFCRMGSGNFQHFQSLQDPRRHAVSKTPVAAVDSEPCTFNVRRVDADLYVRGK